MILFKLNFVLFALLIKPAYEEQPVSYCVSEYPFRLSDSSCSSFTDICIKKGDEECKKVLESCKQCPPSDYAVLILSRILNDNKNILNISIEEMKNAFKTLRVGLNSSLHDRFKDWSKLIPDQSAINKKVDVIIAIIIIIFLIHLSLVLIYIFRHKLLKKYETFWKKKEDTPCGSSNAYFKVPGSENNQGDIPKENGETEKLYKSLAEIKIEITSLKDKLDSLISDLGSKSNLQSDPILENLLSQKCPSDSDDSNLHRGLSSGQLIDDFQNLRAESYPAVD